MTKAFVLCLALFLTGSVAQADPARSATDEITVSHPHNYWLSDGLNRLAFWPSHPQTVETGRSVAKDPAVDPKR